MMCMSILANLPALTPASFAAQRPSLLQPCVTVCSMSDVATRNLMCVSNHTGSSVKGAADLKAGHLAKPGTPAMPVSILDTMTSTRANTSDTCCAFGSPSVSVQGPLRRKRPASPTLTLDSQSTIMPSGKKLCFPAVASYRRPQPSLSTIYSLPASTDHGLSSHADRGLDKQLCNSSISHSEQRQSSFTALDHFRCGNSPALQSLASACDDDDEGIDEAESRFAAFHATPLPKHAANLLSRESIRYSRQSANAVSSEQLGAFSHSAVCSLPQAHRSVGVVCQPQEVTLKKSDNMTQVRCAE